MCVSEKLREQCCGCTACMSICPHSAIQMQKDTMGFAYPIVDDQKCTHCGLCLKVCSFHANYDTSRNLNMPEAYGVRHKEMAEVLTSRSGAAFIAISDWIIEKGGLVYGAAFDDKFRVFHKRTQTAKERNDLKGSKYVQSDLGNVFKQIKCDLESGRRVLFSGTPCQTSGLRSYIGPKYEENLFLVDIVCHGVPSPNIWEDYLSYVERKYKASPIMVSFRDKSELGWAAHKESFTFPNKKIYRNTYTYLFYEHIMFRPSCGVCPFSNMIRPSDITLADFWGWEKYNQWINEDDKGLSLLLINTDKGKAIFDEIRESLYSFPVPVKTYSQPNLKHPSKFHALSNKFEEDYINRGFKYVIRRYSDLGLRYYIKRLGQKSRTLIRILINR